MPLDIPTPWLRPVNVQEALSSGGSAGLGVARNIQSAESDSARLGMEAARMRQSAALEQARLNQEAAQSQMEFQARQKVAEQNQLREQQRLAIENAYKTAALGVAKGRLEQTQAAAEEKAKTAAMQFQREQAFAADVASGVSPMEAYMRNPVSPSLLNSVSRTQAKEDQSEKPVIREGRYPIVRVNPKTGVADVVYTPKTDSGSSILGAASTESAPPPAPNLLSRIRNVFSPSQPVAPKVSRPVVGQIQKGYKFTGGDPSDQDNWEPVNEGE